MEFQNQYRFRHDGLLVVLSLAQEGVEVLLRQLAVRQAVEVHLLLAVAVRQEEDLSVNAHANDYLVGEHSIHHIFLVALLDVQDLSDEVDSLLTLRERGDGDVADRFAVKNEVAAHDFVEEGVLQVGDDLLSRKEDGQQILKLDGIRRSYSVTLHTLFSHLCFFAGARLVSSFFFFFSTYAYSSSSLSCEATIQRILVDKTVIVVVIVVVVGRLLRFPLLLFYARLLLLAGLLLSLSPALKRQTHMSHFFLFRRRLISSSFSRLL